MFISLEKHTELKDKNPITVIINLMKSIQGKGENLQKELFHIINLQK